MYVQSGQFLLNICPASLFTISTYTCHDTTTNTKSNNGNYGIMVFPTLGSGVAGLNIATEIPAMTVSRDVIFGRVIDIISKSIFEEKK